jgi:hypothetical protein
VSFYIAPPSASEVNNLQRRAEARLFKDDCLMSTGDNPPEFECLSPIRQFIRRIWPLAIIVLGIAMTAAWTFVLVYGVVKLLELTI